MARKTVEAWKIQGFDIYCITWDKQTFYELLPQVTEIALDERKSWGTNQNTMMAHSNWDLWICGNDDIAPIMNLDKLEGVANRHPDCMIGMGPDTRALCVPVITRNYYESHKPTMDEGYFHNCVDYDASIRAIREKKFIWCPTIEYAHFSKDEAGSQEFCTQEYLKIHLANWGKFPEDEARLKSKWGCTEVFQEQLIKELV
jgi:GT2 family glycosyltransferase